MFVYYELNNNSTRIVNNCFDMVSLLQCYIPTSVNHGTASWLLTHGLKQF